MSTVAVQATKYPAMNKSDASARWTALDSRHERLVTASDAVLAGLDRKSDRNELKAAS